MSITLREMFRFIRLSSGRRVHMYRRMRAIAERFGDTNLVAQIDRAIEHDRGTRRLDDQWRATSGRRSLYGSNVAEIDSRMDQIIKAIRDLLVAYANGLPESDPRQAMAAALLETLFPAGMGAVISLPYVEQVTVVENIIKDLTTGLAPQVTALGMQDLIGHLTAVAAEYREALDAGRVELGFTPVRSARDLGHVQMLEVVSLVIATYRESESADQAERRDELLAPLFQEVAAVRARRRARRPGDELPGEDEVVPDPDDVEGSEPGDGVMDFGTVP